jgi:hypothetical protein
LDRLVGAGLAVSAAASFVSECVGEASECGHLADAPVILHHFALLILG